MSQRFEVKIPIPMNRLHLMQHWLNSHPLHFIRHHPERCVNSLYLDTPHLQRYEENLSGISQRRKARIRWYGDLRQPQSATLEFKHRRGGKGFKHNYPVLFNWETSCSWFSQIHACLSQLPLDAQCQWGNELSPILISRYRRRYFISADRTIRATFDDEMQCYDQRYHHQANFTRSVSLGAYTLLELKADAGHERQLSGLVATCPLRPSRHSKYVNGIRHLTWC